MLLNHSLLFVPGNDPDVIQTARASNADIVVMDLEDGVAPAHKDEALETTLSELPEWVDGDQTYGVRINGVNTDRGVGDASALVDSGVEPDFLALPDVNGPGDIELLAEVLDDAGSDADILPLIEKPSAVFNVYAVARASERIYGLNFAAIDFQNNVGIPILKETDLTVPRFLVSMAASTVGALAFDKPNLAAVNDMDRTRREAEEAKALGYDGKLAMSVEQAEVINDVFSPSSETVERARRIVEAFNDSDAGLLTVDGVAVDKPVVDQLETVLDRAEEDM